MSKAWTEIVQLIGIDFPKFRVVAYTDEMFFDALWKMGWRMGATTIWNTVYMDPALIGTDRGAELLKHELVHVRDQHTWHILFFLSYFLLPFGPSFKAFWEWRGYRESIRAVWLEYEGADKALRDTVMTSYCEWVASQFWDLSYFYMWPFKSVVRAWCAHEVAKLTATQQ